MGFFFRKLEFISWQPLYSSVPGLLSITLIDGRPLFPVSPLWVSYFFFFGYSWMLDVPYPRKEVIFWSYLHPWRNKFSFSFPLCA